MGVPLAGIGGQVKIGAVTVANILDWAVTAKSDVSETTPFGAAGAWATNTATIKHWSAKFGGSTDGADTTGQVALINGLGTVLVFEFDVDATHHWGGSAIVVGIDPKATAKGMNDIAFAVDGTGALTFT